ncbi:HGGxSTG domain-containing protein [Sphingomonas sp. NPDC019816]|uniref:HGGxSTG domain-containing protein n=1 Tax=Sphingomonas sp. NPDC019816 TaxID=3390679 RepID=UPI003D054EF5
MLTIQRGNDARLRKLWRDHFTECARLTAEYRDANDAYIRNGGGGVRRPEPPCYPPFPIELRGLICGAKSRSGQPCKRTDLMTNGRCRFHGGLSIGPTPTTGKAMAAANLARR